MTAENTPGLRVREYRGFSRRTEVIAPGGKVAHHVSDGNSYTTTLGYSGSVFVDRMTGESATNIVTLPNYRNQGVVYLGGLTFVTVKHVSK